VIRASAAQTMDDDAGVDGPLRPALLQQRQ
jgi:hypothetical protein